MDPFSAAASSFAVVSLAIQLIGTVNNIQGFLQNIEDAPQEVIRLMSVIQQLNAILNEIRVIIERQQALSFDLQPLPSMFLAMQACQEQLKYLSSLLSKLKNRSDVRSKISRSWTSLRLVTKREDIKRLETQLHYATTNLIAAMSINATHIKQVDSPALSRR